jgi:NADH dehydrogenase [ubiquinone] 1 alpha subcomplex assembly factor 6
MGLPTRETRPSSARSGAAAEDASLAALVRRHDHDRFQTALFAPPRQRDALFALYAFNYEIARVREAVSEPMLGQIRLQWWREVVSAAFSGEAPRQHVVAEPLTAIIREFGLSRDYFERLIDARERDLDPEPPASLAALEDYADGSSASLVLLALEMLGANQPEAQEAGRAVGIGYALAGLIRAMPFHAAARRSYIPADLAARTGLKIEDYEARRMTAALRVAVNEIAAAARRHLSEARSHRAAIPRAAIAAVLPALIAERFLRRLERVGYDPFDRRLALPDPMQSWRLAAAALLNRF